jgi:hypothetical protein
MKQRLENLEGERKELERDAYRWRWLRHQRGWPESEMTVMNWMPEQFDALADEALARERGKT